MVLDLSRQSVGDRYLLLDQLGQGGMGTVHRALDRLTGQYVALKQVLLSASDSELEHHELSYALAQEFHVLASLRHPNIISVLDYGFDEQPYFTLELLENAKPFLTFAQNQPLKGQVDLTLQLLQALAYLHRRGILHRDLKPSNVMVVEGQVKVLDFGLALTRRPLVTLDGIGSDSGTAEGVVGTLYYVAPEMILNVPASIASDLYAVGVMLYQLCAGQLPFTTQGDPRALMVKIATEYPDYDRFPDHPLRMVIERLLLKDPDDRYPSAEETMHAVCTATDTPPPHETIAVRESFLQAANFVGRDIEFHVLRQALGRAVDGHGGAWLIGGESGVGKSRLIDELRTQALIAGALVLRGQAVAEGGLSYQIWRDALRRLLLHSDVSDFAASVLKPIVPDIDRLIGRHVTPSPDIDSQSLQLRLLAVIESLFRQQDRLIVLLLEDLHWADDSVLLLNRLNDLAAHKPLLIVATYRDDERPELQKQLPNLRAMKLGRLSDDAIEQLSESILGENGSSPEIVDFLKRETEGNVFFIVEVVRALAEESGQLADIGHKPLPNQVFVGGIKTAVTRRLNKVPQSARALMALAAIIGRELDLSLLRAIAPNVDLDRWLQQVSIVIDSRGDQYRFAHDKLREGILAAIPVDQRRQAHRRVAVAIEALYPDSTHYYAALAYHWGEAQEAAKTVTNATLAGQQAMRSGGYREAIRFFEQALAFAPKAALPRQKLSDLHRLIGESYWGQTNMAASRESHFQALRILGNPVPKSRWGLMLSAAIAFMQHQGYQVVPPSPRRHAQDWFIVAKCLHQIAQGSYHDTNLRLGVYCVLNGMNASQRAGTTPAALRLQSLQYASFGFALGDLGNYKAADRYLRIGKERLSRAPDVETQAWLDYIQGLYLTARGEWETCLALLAAAAQGSKATGSFRLWGESVEYSTYTLYLQSRFTEALAVIEETAHTALREGHVQSIGRFYLVKSRLLLLMGKTDAAYTHYSAHETTIQTAIQGGGQQLQRIILNVFLTEYYTRIEAWDEALRYGAILDDLLINAQTFSSVLAGMATASLRLYLTLWELGEQPTENKARALVQLHLYHRKYTRPHEIGDVVEQTYYCWYHWLNKDEAQARATGERAIAAAQRYHMPYYEAAARYHLARFLPSEEPSRADHLVAARTLFEQTGAAHDAELVARLTRVRKSKW